MTKDLVDVVNLDHAGIIKECKERFMQLTRENQNLVIAFMMGMEVVQNTIKNK